MQTKSATVREKECSLLPSDRSKRLRCRALCTLSRTPLLVFGFAPLADTSKMYDGWAAKASGGGLDASDDDAYGDGYEEVEAAPPFRTHAQQTPQHKRSAAAAKEVDFALVLAKAFGVGLDEGARVDTVAEGGQFAAAGARRGDLIVAAGTSLVHGLGDFEAAVAEHARAGHLKLVVTFRKPKTKQAPVANAGERPGAVGGKKRKRRSGGGIRSGAAVSAADAAAAEAVTVEAVQLVRRGDVAGALPLFSQATALNPLKVDLWSNLGNGQRDAGQAALAAAAYRRGLQLDPRNGHILASLQELAASVKASGGATPLAQQQQHGSRRLDEGLCDDGLEVEVRQS